LFKGWLTVISTAPVFDRRTAKFIGEDAHASRPGERVELHFQAELENLTRSPIVNGHSIESGRIQVHQFERLKCQRLMKKK
jgi:hypothetical protein